MADMVPKRSYVIIASWLVLVVLAVDREPVSATSRFASLLAASDGEESDYGVNEAFVGQSRIASGSCYKVVTQICLPGAYTGNITIPSRTTTTISPPTSSASTTTTTTSTTTTSTTTSTNAPSPTPTCYNDQFDCPTTNYICTDKFICTNTNTGRNVSITKCSTDCPASSCPSTACRPCTTGSQKTCAIATTRCTDNLFHCSKRNYICNGALQCVSQTTGATEPATPCSTSCPLRCGAACTLCAPSKICPI